MQKLDLKQKKQELEKLIKELTEINDIILQEFNTFSSVIVNVFVSEEKILEQFNISTENIKQKLNILYENHEKINFHIKESSSEILKYFFENQSVLYPFSKEKLDKYFENFDYHQFISKTSNLNIEFFHLISLLNINRDNVNMELTNEKN